MKKINCNTLIIGGGPAGIMAAIKASEKGSDVILVEKNNRLGIKLLITGKGRCNITNAENNVKKLVERYGKNGKFLYSSLNNFCTQDIVKMLEKHGLNTKVEQGNRIFPTTDKSADVLNLLVKLLKKQRVEIMLNSAVKKVVAKRREQNAERGAQNANLKSSTYADASEDKQISELPQKNSKSQEIKRVILEDGTEIIAKKYILTTGGKSYPATGSTGEAFLWLRALGHDITKLSPALVPIRCSETFIADLEGLSLRNVEIAAYQNNKKQLSHFGEAVFTNNGMSGPIIQDMSASIGELLDEGEVKLRIDFKPALDFPTLDKRVQKDFALFNNKQFKNSLDKLLPKSLIPIIIKLSTIDPDKKVNLITKEERNRLVHLLKEFELTVTSLEKFSKAIITRGGVNLKEVDPKTMQSKIIDNLYFAGEILDLDGPTGGYNLQLCWSTGFAAGSK